MKKKEVKDCLFVATKTLKERENDAKAARKGTVIIDHELFERTQKQKLIEAVVLMLGLVLWSFIAGILFVLATIARAIV